jgi:hypothetical protein
MCRQEVLKFEVIPGKVSKTLSQKQNKNKRAGGMIQMVKC